MKRRIVVRAALAATGALAIAAGTAGAHPMDFGTTSDSWINSGVGVHWKSHGAAGAVAGRKSVPAGEDGLNWSASPTSAASSPATAAWPTSRPRATTPT